MKWDSLSDADLMRLPMRKLKLSLRTSFVYPLIKKVLKELAQKGIKIRPIFWVSDEWFCPDGILGIAIPFYLLHSRLMSLEEQMVGRIEGGTKEWCLKILRHELGHVIDNAFQLHKHKNRAAVFGKSSQHYPSYYTYRPYTRNFVRHLEEGYAQSHPAEDFAETFAVWLDPKSDWQKRYQNWPALTKLEFMDQMMKEIRGKKASIRSKKEIDPLRTIKKTLSQHYQMKKRKVKPEGDKFWDTTLKRLPLPVLTNERIQILRKNIAQKIGVPLYQIDQVARSLQKRSKILNSQARPRKTTNRQKISYYLSIKAKKFLAEKRHYIAL